MTSFGAARDGARSSSDAVTCPARPVRQTINATHGSVAFNADLATVVWVGYDDDLPLGPGEEGSRTALPIWIEFMRLAMRGVPEHQMAMPEGIVSRR